ncbi:hypothetical protein DVH26_31130 [Paenibacillus sp. H1-7]|uniref:DUF4367 domain-containing protein n=1 Tax=Paenibacillus sp. H1-7 TaxID=2282849 RepID=UPI001EF8F757|nr:DUF4367 domain-containing protein [Paenibacillus sp. H1-7]ULL18532.1 hypothetical protein DVH26_31130 [Paenibacillus sp. H1-7]
MSRKRDIKQFRELTEWLARTEIDDAGSQDRTFNRLKFKMETGTIQPHQTTKDGISMKKTKWKSIAVSAMAVVCLGGAFATTSSAQEMLASIMARFQVGNMEITQYKELPEIEPKSTDAKQQTGEARSVQREAPPKLTLKEARTATGMNFPAPTWLSESYKLVNVVVQGSKMVEVQYEKEGDFISLLISTGGNNGISTEGEVKTETIGGKTVYFANGIVIWEQDGFTYELYQMSEQSFDAAAIGSIIGSMSTTAK